MPRTPSHTPSMTNQEEVNRGGVCVYMHAHASTWRYQGTKSISSGWVAHRACLWLQIYGGGWPGCRARARSLQALRARHHGIWRIFNDFASADFAYSDCPQLKRQKG